MTDRRPLFDSVPSRGLPEVGKCRQVDYSVPSVLWVIIAASKRKGGRFGAGSPDLPARPKSAH